MFATKNYFFNVELLETPHVMSVQLDSVVVNIPILYDVTTFPTCVQTSRAASQQNKQLDNLFVNDDKTFPNVRKRETVTPSLGNEGENKASRNEEENKRQRLIKY
jgi:hypothetical protein